jgi:hypothetical protein
MLSAIAIGLSACGDGDQAEPEEQTSEREELRLVSSCPILVGMARCSL